MIGAGNLGVDLADELRKIHGILDVNLLSKASGFDVTDPVQMEAMLTSVVYDAIWYAVGFGSVAEAAKYPEMAHLFHVKIPNTIARFADKESKLIFFSSDYAADENQPHRPDIINPTPRSNYAFLKAQMECELIQFDRPNTAIVRVGSLYGLYKPLNTFPGKIIKNFSDSDSWKELPQNSVTPTPTLWAAHMLARNFDLLFSKRGTKAHHCAPRGNVNIRDWGKMILDQSRIDYKLTNRCFYDDQRPIISALGCSFNPHVPHWFDLFETYFRPRWFKVNATNSNQIATPLHTLLSNVPLN